MANEQTPSVVSDSFKPLVEYRDNEYPFDSTGRSDKPPSSPASIRSYDFESLKRRITSISSIATKVHTFQLWIPTAFLAIVLPMVILPSVLVSLILAFQVTENDAPSPELRTAAPKNQTDDSAYFVRQANGIAATSLVLISSLISTITTTLTGMLMLLFSYSVARSIAKASSSNQHDQLPTPYQLNLLMGSLAGNTGTLRHWITYMARKDRSRIAPPVLKSFFAFITILFLSLLVSATDIWLHRATKTVAIQQILANVGPSDFAPSRQVAEWCRNWNSTGLVNTSWLTAHINETFETSPWCSSSVKWYMGSSETLVNYWLLNNMSAVHDATLNVSNYNQIQLSDDDYPHAVVGQANPPTEVDYVAESFSVQTQCHPRLSLCDPSTLQSQDACLVNSTAGQQWLNASQNLFIMDYFLQDSSDPGQFLTDDTMNDPVVEDPMSASAISNPITALSAASANPGLISWTDSELHKTNVYPQGTIPFLLLSCSIAVYNIRYTSLSSSIHILNATLAPPSLAGSFTWPLSAPPNALQPSYIGQTIFANALAGATSTASFANNSAIEISKALAAFGAPVLGPAVPDQLQTRETVLVARVPRAPLWVLVGLCAVYVVGGTVVAAVAWGAGREAGGVQARLSVGGLIGELFGRGGRGEGNDIEGRERDGQDLFSERRGGRSYRIGVREVEEGWRFCAR